MEKRINLDNLDRLSSDRLFDWLDGISDEQAVHSDVDGSSDASDELPQSRRSMSQAADSEHGASKSLDSLNLSSPRPQRQMKKRTYAESDKDIDFDSDDSVDDPDYQQPRDPIEAETIPADVYNIGEESEAESIEGLANNEGEKETFQFSKTASAPHKYANSKFSRISGPTVPINTESPSEVFVLVFGESTLEQITKESNIYAQQSGVTLNLNTEELRAFIGILIIMGLHQLPSLRLYWSCDSNFRVDRIADIISQKRFLKIIRYLHVNNNETMPKKGEPNFDKLYKIRPVIDNINKNIKELFVPDKHLSIDESMVGFKGRTSLKQYMPMKPIRRGFKVWVLACSKTSYGLQFQVYEGRATDPKPECTLGERVVISLSEYYWNNGYCFFYDNFFSSFNLLKLLLDRESFACGTFRVNRKHYPKNLLKEDKQMKLGDSDFAQSDDYSVVKWRDHGKKSVVVISSMHNPAETLIIKRKNKKGERENVQYPVAIVDYNSYMGGVDRFDQLLACYNISWKSKRWWLKLLYYFIDAAIVNAYILYKQTVLRNNTNKPISHLKFRSILANELICSYNGRIKKGPAPTTQKKIKKTTGRTVSVDHALRKSDVGLHMPIKGTSRRCALFSTTKKSKRSEMCCNKCNIALCLQCFLPFHQ